MPEYYLSPQEIQRLANQLGAFEKFSFGEASKSTRPEDLIRKMMRGWPTVYTMPLPLTPGASAAPAILPGYEHAPSPLTTALYEHLFAASYASAFDDVTMHRVLPVCLYLDVPAGSGPPWPVLRALAGVLDAYDYDVVLEYPDLEGSFFKKLFVRTRSRKTRGEMDTDAADLATKMADTAAAQFTGSRIRLARSVAERAPKTTVRDVVGLQKDRAEVKKLEAEEEKLKAETWELRSSALTNFAQAMKHVAIGASVVWFVVVDGQGAGGGPDPGVKGPAPIERVELGRPVDLMQRLVDAKSPEEVKTILDEYRGAGKGGTKETTGSGGGTTKKAPGPGASRK